MAREKYPHGYLPKIGYWDAQLKRAQAAGDNERFAYCYGKMAYFSNRHIETYGPIGVDEVQLITKYSLGLL